MCARAKLTEVELLPEGLHCGTEAQLLGAQSHRWSLYRNNSDQPRPMLEVGCHCVEPSALGVWSDWTRQLRRQFQQITVMTELQSMRSCTALILAYAGVARMLSKGQWVAIPECKR